MAGRKSEPRSALVLLAEDEKTDAFLMQRVFAMEAPTAKMVRVVDGQDVIDYLFGQAQFADREQHPQPNLVILDLNMPRVGGIEVLRTVRSRPEHIRTPIIVLSASERERDINAAYDAGANAYMVKPLTYDDYRSMAKAVSSFWLHLNRT